MDTRWVQRHRSDSERRILGLVLGLIHCLTEDFVVTLGRPWGPGRQADGLAQVYSHLGASLGMESGAVGAGPGVRARWRGDSCDR